MKNLSIFLMLLCFACFGVANAQQSLPYSYGFENNDLAADGWTTQNPSGLNAYEFGINVAAAKSGSYGFRFSSYSDRGESTQYLISPELVAPNGVIVQFYYKVSTSYTDGETFQVGYSTTDDNISSFTFGSENNATNTSWEQTEELVFPAGTKYVAVYYSANYQYRLYVDDFSFTAAPSCLKPTLSNEVILSMENASVQWTENGTATNWELQYSTNADFSGATTINRNGIPVYNISDLSAATTYYARVRANCGGGDYSDWSNVISFTTWSCEQPTVVEYDLADSYGDGWNGNAIQIFDGCGDLVETLTIASGYSNSGTLDLCGDYYQFVWVSGSYANETSFTFTVNGTAIYSQQSGNDFTDGQELHAIGIQPPVKPTALTAGTPSANEVQLSWTENGTATTWQICINDDENNLVVANSNPFTLTGLNAVTAYTVKVRSTDGTSVSCWSNAVSFTTDSSCPTPNNLTVTNLMPTSATLNWEGEADSYNVRYGMAGGEVAVFEDGFENGLENWTIISNGAYTGTTWQQFNVDEFGNEGLTNHNGSYVTMSRSWGGNSVGDVSVDNWLITPQVALNGDLKYWVINDDGNGYAEQYAIYVSTTGNSISDFTLLYTPQNNSTTWTEHVVDLRSYNGTLGYIAIRHNDYGKDFLFIDDFGIYATQDAGEWINATSTTNSLDITGLTSEANYVFQVQTDCGTEGESNWSASATFTTPDACAVPTDLTAEITGNAAELSWTGAQEYYNVKYREVAFTAPATIIPNVPTDITDKAGTWTQVEWVNNPYTLENLNAQTTYEFQVQGIDCDGNDGTTEWSEVATFTTGEFYTKTIEAYEGEGGYYLIASPLANNVAPTDVVGMITDNLGATAPSPEDCTYDLYSFDQSETYEWQNYRAGTFELVNGQGYLYASKEGTDLVFTGAGNSNNTQDVTIYMTDVADGLDFPDWNLVGNPFAKDNAYLSDGRAFYSMQNSAVLTPQLGPVAIGPMEGVFVVANSNEETLTFTTTQPNSKVAQLNLNLTKSASTGSALLDRAIVSFGEGSQLPKFQFRKGSTQVYIPMEGKDYAVVRSEAMGTMPVNFKAEQNGSYTLSFTSEQVSFGYLHLIDNMNGNDVDLLANPSYSFEAKTTDYESRFKLVFATGNSNDDAFAFYSNGSFVINNSGDATLQVIDVTGRILSSENINGCANVNFNAANGVYMLRLVNGDNVKVQKVVVK